jgi:hypothetical protein
LHSIGCANTILMRVCTCSSTCQPSERRKNRVGRKKCRNDSLLCLMQIRTSARFDWLYRAMERLRPQADLILIELHVAKTHHVYYPLNPYAARDSIQRKCSLAEHGCCIANAVPRARNIPANCHSSQSSERRSQIHYGRVCFCMCAECKRNCCSFVPRV